MKALSFVVISLAMSAAMANPPAAHTTTTTQSTTTAQPTEKKTEKTETTTTTAPGAAHADKCVGKTGKDLEACNKAKKAH